MTQARRAVLLLYHLTHAVRCHSLCQLRKCQDREARFVTRLHSRKCFFKHPSVKRATDREHEMVGTVYLALVFPHNRNVGPDLSVASGEDNCQQELETHLTTTFMLSSGDNMWFLTDGWLPSSRRSATPFLK